jgi:AmmeMemoRadiSam system protein A
MLTNQEKEQCLKIAREAIAFKLNIIKEITPYPPLPIFNESYGLFVTLHKNDRLRGCIGYILPYKKLYNALIDLAQSAAFKDPRFSPVSKDEFNQLNIEISILSQLYEVKNTNEITIGRDGLYIQHPHSSGLLLPQVATQYNWDKDTFLIETCHKAGLHESYLKDPQIKIFRFEAEIF